MWSEGYDYEDEAHDSEDYDYGDEAYDYEDEAYDSEDEINPNDIYHAEGTDPKIFNKWLAMRQKMVAQGMADYGVEADWVDGSSSNAGAFSDEGAPCRSTMTSYMPVSDDGAPCRSAVVQAIRDGAEEKLKEDLLQMQMQFEGQMKAMKAMQESRIKAMQEEMERQNKEQLRLQEEKLKSLQELLSIANPENGDESSFGYVTCYGEDPSVDYEYCDEAGGDDKDHGTDEGDESDDWPTPHRTAPADGTTVHGHGRGLDTRLLMSTRGTEGSDFTAVTNRGASSLRSMKQAACPSWQLRADTEEATTDARFAGSRQELTLRGLVASIGKGGRAACAGIQKLGALIMPFHIAKVIQCLVCIACGILFMGRMPCTLFSILVMDMPPSVAFGMKLGSKSMLDEQQRLQKEPNVLGWMWTNIGMNGVSHSAFVYIAPLLYCYDDAYLRDAGEVQSSRKNERPHTADSRWAGGFLHDDKSLSSDVWQLQGKVRRTARPERDGCSRHGASG
eukprot:TRINITY_DN8175_c0_g3_i2.p1 TRINITY_DN8175_c0_g3~~TRINITY_DN8175_c0_g3_i2.p1  ORF type:complete len:504 (+),score=121.90 TRINITY_DN8175_c0_g3_i2:181-1692(+)